MEYLSTWPVIFLKPFLFLPLATYLNLDRFGVELFKATLQGFLQFYQTHLQELGQETLPAPVHLLEFSFVSDARIVS